MENGDRMSYVLIKEFQGYKITLYDTVDYKFNYYKFAYISIILMILSLFIAYAIMFMSTISLSLNTYGWLFNYIWISIASFGIFIVMGFLFTMYDDEIPSYCISSDCDVKSIYVPKILLDIDENAICKAVKQIESNIIIIVDKNEKLKLIAERCK